MNYVVDASVAVKWYIPETLTEKAVQILESRHKSGTSLWAPDLIFPEMGNVLWKKAAHNELLEEEVKAVAAALSAVFPVKLYESTLLLPAALELALAFHSTVYDCLYLALAVTRNALLVTADQKLVNTFRGSPFSANIKYLGDF